MSVKGKTVLITGASSGIGKACAEIYAKNGANIVITARRKDRLATVEKEIKEKYSVNVISRIFDVRNKAETENFGKELEKANIIPNIFINNAGLAKGQEPIYEGNSDCWDEMIDTNIKGFLYMAKAIIPLMMKNNSGSIINLGSIAGSQVYPGGNVYNSTKFAVKALSQAMNIDLVNTNIRVCAIEPGAVETEFSYVRFNGDEVRAKNVYKGFKPLTGDDIAEIIYFVTALPEHINIQSLLVTPTAQRSATIFNRQI